MQPTRKVILYIAASLDGYIAMPNDDLSFLEMVQKEGEDYGYFDFVSQIDTVIMGRKTYEWVMKQVPEFPHSDKESYIITRKSIPKEGNVTFYNGELKGLIAELKQREGKDIFVDGGAEIVNELLKDDLIDEYYISIIPVLLGNGISLFKEGIPMLELQLVKSQSYDTGLVQLYYIRKK
ncbi:MAG: dihydrofolate reductase family protein [Cytophagales bacterium]|nr:dihydrofolate reductase family protein [Cytophagales bacterium]